MMRTVRYHPVKYLTVKLQIDLFRKKSFKSNEVNILKNFEISHALKKPNLTHKIRNIIKVLLNMLLTNNFQTRDKNNTGRHNKVLKDVRRTLQYKKSLNIN